MANSSKQQHANKAPRVRTGLKSGNTSDQKAIEGIIKQLLKVPY